MEVSVVDLSVAEVADRLGLSSGRIRQLVAAGRLPAQRVGRDWVVDSEALSYRPLPVGRRFSPPRAWGALALLSGVHPDWLSASARSQVKAVLRRLENGDPNHWSGLLSARSDVYRVSGHPAAIARLASSEELLPSGPAAAAGVGLPLVAAESVVERLGEQESWGRLRVDLQLDEVAPGHPVDAVVRVPRLPQALALQRTHVRFRALSIAADLLDSPEPRAVSVGLAALQSARSEALA
jgi:excisionase family DNA binding protein